MEEADEATVMKRRWKFFDVGGRGRWKRYVENEGRGVPMHEGRATARTKDEVCQSKKEDVWCA